MSVHDVPNDRPSRHPSADPALTALALLYATGELESAEAAVFEARLGEDQSARDALCQAVQLTQTLGGVAAPLPDSRYRDRVREQLLPGRPAGPRSVGPRPRWWSPLLRPRLYRGHPALWAWRAPWPRFCCWVSGHRPPLPSTPKAPPVPAPHLTVPLPADSLPEPEIEGDTTTEMAQVWANLQNCEHLARVRDEEHRRRQRVEERRTGKPDEHGAHDSTH